MTRSALEKKTEIHPFSRNLFADGFPVKIVTPGRFRNKVNKSTPEVKRRDAR